MQTDGNRKIRKHNKKTSNNRGTAILTDFASLVNTFDRKNITKSIEMPKENEDFYLVE